MFAEAILAAMMTLPCPADEPKAECAPWRAEVATAIAQAANEATCSNEFASPECRRIFAGKSDELAAWLVEIAYHESGLRKRIQANRCNDDECDAVRHAKTRVHYKHLARSMWQLHESPTIPGVETDVPHDRWLASVGTDPTSVLVAARTAARLLVRSPKSFGVSFNSKGPRGRATWRLLGQIRDAAR